MGPFGEGVGKKRGSPIPSPSVNPLEGANVSTDDRSGDVLPFPRVALPPSFDAGGAPPPASAGDDPDVPPVGAWPALPDLSTMRPPLHLTVPGVPDAESTDDGEGESCEQQAKSG